MNEIKDGKVPQPKNDEWKNLVSVATTISGGIKVEDLGKPSGIDRTRLEAELKKCETFEAAVKQTREHLVNLIETQPHLPQVVSDLTEAESHLAKAAESADKLGKLYAHLAVIPTPIPGVQHYFAWGVYDIEVVVKKAVNEAHGSVQKLLDMQKRRLEGYPKSIEGWQKFADETDVWLPKMRNACAAKP